MFRKISVILSVCMFSLLLVSCAGGDTYKLAKTMAEYERNQTGYEKALKMAQKGNYDANCTDCFRGMDTPEISLFAYACEVDFEIAKAIYDNGADIEVTNLQFKRSPLLAAVHGNRNNPEIVYWLIEQGADINAVDFQNACVFHYLRYWEDNEDTQDLICYFTEHCDLQYLQDNTSGNPFCEWDEMWSDAGELCFYER